MSTTVKIWLVIGAVLVIAGISVFVWAMNSAAWDFTKLGTASYVSNTHSVSDPFDRITLITDVADAVFLTSDDGKCRVECYENEKALHSVAVSDGTLRIEVQDKRSWFDHIGVNLGAPKITVYLPEKDYASVTVNETTGGVELAGTLSFESIDVETTTGRVVCGASASGKVRISTTTGAVTLDGTTAGSIEVTVTTGRVKADSVKCDGEALISVATGFVELTDFSCRELESNGSTGALRMKNVIVTEKLTAKRSTGSVHFDACDAAELYVKTSTGNITGSFLTDKRFIAESDTGRVNVPKGTDGGRCELSSSTGNISIEIK